MQDYYILPIISATISFTIGFYDFLTWLQRKKEHYPLAFVACCLCIGLFGLASAWEYRATTAVEVAQCLRLEAILLNLTGVGFLWYISDQTGLVNRRWKILIPIISAFGILSQVIGFGSLTWDLQNTFLVTINLPGFAPFTFLEVQSGIITDIQSYYGILLLLYAFVTVVRFYRSGHQSEAKPLLVILVLVSLAYLNDFLVDSGLYSFFYLIEYSWMAAIFLMGVQRGQKLIEAEQIRHALELSENRYRTIFESLQDVYFQTDRRGHLILLSPSFSTNFGYGQDRILGFNALRFVVDPRERRALFKTFVRRSQVLDHETIIQGPDHRRFEVSITARSSGRETFMGVEGMIRDISERKQTSMALRAALAEKEILINEIHHRVKNNLQIITSLLKLQQGKLPDDRARSVFQDCRNQIYTMAMIHEELYQSRDFKNINFGLFLANLVNRLINSYGLSESVAFIPRMDDIHLDLAKAIPCGLIVNELCSNALKYAFPEGFAGSRRELQVSLANLDNGSVQVTVADTGIGLPAGFNINAIQSLGMKIVSKLCGQIGANLTLDSSCGSAFSIVFNQ